MTAARFEYKEDVPADIVIRLARSADLSAIMDIYNHEVLHATSTFDTEPVTLASREAWLAEHQRPQWPVLVATPGDAVPGVATPGDITSGVAALPAIVGFGSLSAWSTRCAYARAAEVSIYVHRDGRGRGIGRAILAGLIARARAAGLGVLLARICTEGQASLRLHESLGFTAIGTMRRVGEKFGRVLDVALYDLQLDSAPASPASPP